MRRFLSKKASLFLVLFFLLVIPVTVYFTGQQQNTHQNAAGSSMGELLTTTGIRSVNTDLPSDIQKQDNGTFIVSAATCSDPQKDRFEIVFNRDIKNIYGLGMIPFFANDGVDIPDFLDTHFSSGSQLTHPYSPDPDPNEFNPDYARTRIPIFVIPEESMIIRYIQPYPKIVRLERKDPNLPNTTTIVMKKNNTYVEGTCGSLLVVKGSNISDAYVKYNTYLKQQYFFKKPHWNAFGLGWETWNEYHCDTGIRTVQEADKYYQDAKIKLSNIMIGSGYWTGPTGCDSVDPNTPTMDSLAVSAERFGSTQQLKDYFSDLTSRDIYPVIGMRHSIHPGNQETIKNKLRAKRIPSSIPIYYPNDTSPFIFFGYPPSNNVSYLNTSENGTVIASYIDLLKDAYGNFKGIKEDEMIMGDQKAYKKAVGGDPSSVTNFPDGSVEKVYETYTLHNNNDFMIMGANDYFGVGTDLQNGGGHITGIPLFGKPEYKGFYEFKYFLDKTLRLNISGFPHPVSEAPVWTNLATYEGQKELLRLYQLNTFMPGDIQSQGFWHLGTEQLKKQYVNFSQFRERLHQYAYDKAMQWYATGEPVLMRPLFMDYQNDPNVYNLYHGFTLSDPLDEFMMGQALLIAPVLTSTDTVNVYLPEGKWKPLFKKSSEIEAGTEFISGRKNISYPLLPSIAGATDGLGFDYPVFLKEGKIVLLKDVTSEELVPSVFLDTLSSSDPYTVYNKDGSVRVTFKAIKIGTTVYYVNVATNGRIMANSDPYEKGFKQTTLTAIINSQPPLASPTTLTHTCNELGTECTITWNSVAGSSFYYVRVDKSPDSHACSNPGDYCADSPVGTTAYTFATTPGTAYKTWVHAARSAQDYSEPPVQHSFTSPTICTTTAPTLLSPQGTQSVGIKTFTWSPIPHATAYAFRLDDTMDGFLSPNDYANDNISGTSFTAPLALLAGHNYNWWVHAILPGCSWTGAATAPVHVPANPTLTPTPRAVGDIIGTDGAIDLLDFARWLCEYRGNGTCDTPPKSNKTANLNPDKDSIVDLLDFSIWLNAFRNN